MSDDKKPHDPSVVTEGATSPADGSVAQTSARDAGAPGSPEAEFAASEADQPAPTGRSAGDDAAHPAALTAATGSVAGATTAAQSRTSADRRPIWSDDGDAPFADDPPLTSKSRKIFGPNGKDRRDRKDRDDKPASAGSETLEIIKTIVFALLIAFVLRVLLFQPFTIPSASMEPNLYEGDYIVVSKWSYGYSKFSSGLPINLPLGEGRVFGRAPSRGDIVVFKLPRDDRTDYIKRVIGLPGDRIQMIANKLHINGQPVQDVVVGQSEIADMFGPRSVVRARETLPNGKSFTTQDFGPGGDLDDTPVYEVPAGFYFMMGDNRDNSIDSRVEQSSGVGLVPAQNLVGKAQIIMFSWEPGASLFNPITWFSKIRPSRFFRLLD